MVKLTQIRIYSNVPDDMARFYATLGYEVEGPIEPSDKPDDFPMYYVRHDNGPDIAIFRRRTLDHSVTQGDQALFFFQVESPNLIRDNLQQLGLYREGEEPRSYCERITAVRDPDGRLVALESFFLSRLAEAAKERPWTSTVPKRYNTGEIAIYDGNRYECTRDHVAQEGNPPPKLSPFWRLVEPMAKPTSSEIG